MNAPHDLTDDLRALAQVTAPPEIAANVLARIARVEPVPQFKPLTGAARVRALVADWLSWLLLGVSGGALTLGLVAAINWIATARKLSARMGASEVLDELLPIVTMMLVCLAFYLGGLALPILRLRRSR